MGSLGRLCDAISLSRFAIDPRFATNPDRVRNRRKLVEILTAVVREKTTQEWIKALRSVDVPCGPIQSIDDVFADPQVCAREMLVEVKHPELGPVKMVANPIKFSSTPIEYRKAPPILGEDTVSILTDVLGMSGEEIEELVRQGVT